MTVSSSTIRVLTVAAVIFVGATDGPLVGYAHADAVAYLVNVTVHPGYNFAGPDDALAYGNSICEKISHGRPYADIVADIGADFEISDPFHASYLISQAANELCPAQIWAGRNSAADYRWPTPRLSPSEPG